MQPPYRPTQQQHSVVFDADHPQTQPLFTSPSAHSLGGGQESLQFYNTGSNYGYSATQFSQSSTATLGGQYSTREFVGSPFGTGGYSDEPPLLEELGVNFSHITSKSISVLNFFRTPDRHIMDDTDLAGPIFFCILFGGFLLFSGKIQFGYIYGVAVVGCLSMYMILNLMSESGIDSSRTASVLGYCLLPMVILSIISTLLKLTGWLGFVLSVSSILWCTYSASTMFVTVLSMREQRLLVAYPVGLLYAVFALLTVF